MPPHSLFLYTDTRVWLGWEPLPPAGPSKFCLLFVCCLYSLFDYVCFAFVSVYLSFSFHAHCLSSVSPMRQLAPADIKTPTLLPDLGSVKPKRIIVGVKFSLVLTEEGMYLPSRSIFLCIFLILFPHFIFQFISTIL